MAERPTAILIAGPTASGKSAAALAIARETGGLIVNADSMQVYGGMRIITARPGDADLAVADHRLYGFVDPAEAYSVAAWLDAARQMLAEAKKLGVPAIFTGGTGLYFSALEKGISSLPRPEPAIRAKWREIAARDPARLHPALARLDPQGAQRLAPGDVQRLVRALEMVETTGRSLASLQAASPPVSNLAGHVVERFVLEPPRQELHGRIDARFRAMVEQGALEEVRDVLGRDLDASLPAMKAIGLRQLGDYLSGDCSLEEAIARSQAATRQYAKRQSTWFRGQFGDDWQRVETIEALMAARLR